MSWWTSCRFCAARAKQSDEGCVGTTEGPSFMAAYRDIEWQCYNDEPVNNGNHCTATDANPGINNVPSSIKQFRKMYTDNENYTSYLWLWFREGYHYRGMDLISGGTDMSNSKWSTREVDRALCRE